MKIAVVGAGVSGLAAAYWLRERNEVVLFEASSRLGGHANTVDVEVDGEMHAIDTGFIVFNDRTYPTFVRLLDELSVESVATTMGFSVRCDRSGLEYNGSSFAGLFVQPANFVRPSFWRMLADILRFNREAGRLAESGFTCADRSQTIADFVDRRRYGRMFIDKYLLPMGSAIWSCPLETFADFPVGFVADFYRNHGLLRISDRPQWRTVIGGSRSYVDEMARRMEDRVTILVGTPVEQVCRQTDFVELKVRGLPVERFDHVVFACHADQALKILADPSPLETELLGAFPYQRNVAILHRDESILPQNRRAWASWNYFLPTEPQALPIVSYCMNILQHLRSQHVFSVTLNAENRIDPAKVLGRFVYEHPIFTVRRAAAQARHGELIGPLRTSYCGAYWRNGFHEDGAVSAMAVCRYLNESAARSRSNAALQEAAS